MPIGPAWLIKGVARGQVVRRRSSCAGAAMPQLLAKLVHKIPVDKSPSHSASEKPPEDGGFAWA
jgi:hypothetical protein